MGESHRDQSVDRLLKAELRRTGQGAIPAASEACVDAETFAAWSEGALPPARMSAIESHLADCARCQALMAVFAQTETAAAAVAAPPVRQARPLRWLFPLAAGTVAATLIVWLARPVPPTSTPTETAPTTMIARADEKAAEAPPIGATAAPAPASAALADRLAKNDAKQANAETSEKKEAAAKLQANERRDAASVRTEPPLPVAQTKDATARTVPVPPAQVPTAPPGVASAMPPPPPPTQPPPPPARATVAGLPQSTVNITVDGVQRTAESVARTAVVLEFSSADLQRDQQGQQGFSGGRAGAGGGGGRGGGGAGRGGTVTSATGTSGAGAATTTSTLSTAPIVPPIRWRVLGSGAVERSSANSTTWEPVKIDPPAHIESGAAPAPFVCWLVGRDGVVLVSTNADTFLRVNLPERVDVISVRATTAREATVTTRDGRTYTTVDGGQTWVR